MVTSKRMRTYMRPTYCTSTHSVLHRDGSTFVAVISALLFML